MPHLDLLFVHFVFISHMPISAFSLFIQPFWAASIHIHIRSFLLWPVFLQSFDSSRLWYCENPFKLPGFNVDYFSWVPHTFSLILVLSFGVLGSTMDALSFFIHFFLFFLLFFLFCGQGPNHRFFERLDQEIISGYNAYPLFLPFSCLFIIRYACKRIDDILDELVHVMVGNAIALARTHAWFR